jgi:hypothetical protein
MNRLVPLSLLSFLAACGSSNGNSDGGTNAGTTDYAPLYVGAWTGSAVITADGSSITSQAKVPIQEVSTNVIQLHGFCSDTDAYSSGPEADVTSSGFTLRSDSCSWNSVNCTAGNLTFSWSDGSGTLTNGLVTFAVNGTLMCGTLSVSYNLNFSASQKGSYGSLTAGNNPESGVASGLGRALQ